MTHNLQCLNDFRDVYQKRIAELTARKNEGKKLVGTFCLFVPDEIIYAAGADRVILCGGRGETGEGKTLVGAHLVTYLLFVELQNYLAA
jgi:benzoyl-CoA reductase/2-hydroxyglutaryl-CoA dehydratase subunit BcrC/BadD/HgdB